MNSRLAHYSNHPQNRAQRESMSDTVLFLQYYYSTDGTNFYHMKEELRLEYAEDKDVDEGFEVIEYEE